MLAFRKGEVDLMYVRGKFYLACFSWRIGYWLCSGKVVR
jgi:hypothetical protein